MHRCISRKNKNAVHAFRTIHLLTVTRTHFLLTGVKKDIRLVPESITQVLLYFTFTILFWKLSLHSDAFECKELRRDSRATS